MIRFSNYRQTGRVPTVRVAKVGGVFRQDSGLIKVTLITDSDMAGVHLLWEPWEWVDIQSQLDFVLDSYKNGVFAQGKFAIN